MTDKGSFNYTAAYETVRTVGNLLAPDGLEWLTEIPSDAPPAQTVIHLSCMAHYTPHIPYVAQQILRKIGLDCLIVGGPEFCCGALHLHFGDEDLGKQNVATALSTFRRVRPQKVLSICPDCDEIFAAHGRGRMPYRHDNISELFIEHLDRLREAMQPVERRVAVHFHDANAPRRADSERIMRILQTIPRLEIVATEFARGPGVHCQSLHPMSEEDQTRMFDEARDLGVDSLVVPYHSCYRQHCRMQISHNVEVHHYFGILAMALGIPFTEPFKELRLLDDIDGAVAALGPRIEQFGYDAAEVRSYLAQTVYS